MSYRPGAALNCATTGIGGAGARGKTGPRRPRIGGLPVVGGLAGQYVCDDCMRPTPGGLYTECQLTGDNEIIVWLCARCRQTVRLRPRAAGTLTAAAERAGSIRANRAGKAHPRSTPSGQHPSRVTHPSISQEAFHAEGVKVPTDFWNHKDARPQPALGCEQQACYEQHAC